jgi:hypothetical protein
MGFLDWLFGRNDAKDDRKRVFISFARKDMKYRDYLVTQARENHSPFELIDMSVKKPWNEWEWKKRCRAKIRRCDCVIVLLSDNTYSATGVKWEVKCAKEARIPIRGMYVKKKEIGRINLPPELRGVKTMEWSWDNLANFLN